MLSRASESIGRVHYDSGWYVYVQVYGRRYNCDDAEMVTYRRCTRLFSEACSPVDGAELDAFPWLRHLPHNPLGKMKAARDLLDSFIHEELAKVKVFASYTLASIANRWN